MFLQGDAADQRPLHKSQSVMNIFTYINPVHRLSASHHVFVKCQNFIYVFMLVGC